MNELGIGIIILFVLLALFLTGIELAFGMALLGFIGFSILVSMKAAMNMLAKDVFDTLSSYGLTVIPLFVLMGQIAVNAGIAGRLYNVAHRFMGHVPGGLAIATVAGAALFKTICGSSAATIVTFSSIAIPEMDRYGYSKKLSAGIIAIAGSTLGALIPPSVILIILAILTQQPIGKLFLAGVIPGLMLALFYVFIIVGWCKKNPSIGPRSERYSWKARISSLPGVIWPMVIFLMMIGGITSGVFTPTEGGSVATFSVLLLSLFNKDLDFKGFKKSVKESLTTPCMVLMLITGSTIFGHCITVTNVPMIVAEWVLHLPVHRHLIMILIGFVYLLGGSFVDDLAFCILITPIIFPVIIKLGFDPIWAVIQIVIIGLIGAVIPPIATPVFIIKQVTKIPMGVIYSGVYPFLIAVVACIVLLFIFPEIALFLPNLLMK